MLLCGNRVLTKGIGKHQVVADICYSMLPVCIDLDSGIGLFFMFPAYFLFNALFL